MGLKIKMDTRKDKYNICKLLSIDQGLETIYREIPNYDAVILSDVPAPERNDILKFCYRYRIRTYVSPKLTDIMIRGAKNISLFDTPLLLVKGNGLTPAQRVGKRMMDLILCAIAMIPAAPIMAVIALAIKLEDGGPVFYRQKRLTQRVGKRMMDLILCAIAMIPAAPIMAVIALAIKLEDGGPVFYRQKRLTRNGVEFDILKFRSMIVDAEKYDGAVLATEKDPRITRVGRCIRPLRLDELPQLLNILKGDMSIVGPRPERKVIADEYYKDIPEFAYRLKVRGGLTGYAQIYGKYNTSPYDKLRLDLMYIENYSLLLDVKLILRTLRTGYAQIYGKYNTSPYDKLRLDLMYIENYSLLLDVKLILRTLRILFSRESTEGIDVAEENQRKAEALLDQLEQDES